MSALLVTDLEAVFVADVLVLTIPESTDICLYYVDVTIFSPNFPDSVLER
jgi:hypothetical protein